MTPLPPLSAPGWVLHVQPYLEYRGTLVFDHGGGVFSKIPTTTAHTTVMLALAVCLVIDRREGKTEMLGRRSSEAILRIVRALPGSCSPYQAKTIGIYKRALVRRVRQAIKGLSLETGRRLSAPDPILNHGHSQGYCLPEEGIRVVGVSMDALIRIACQQLDDPPYGS